MSAVTTMVDTGDPASQPSFLDEMRKAATAQQTALVQSGAISATRLFQFTHRGGTTLPFTAELYYLAGDVATRLRLNEQERESAYNALFPEVSE